MGRPKPTLPMTGGCACGAIRYELTSFPLLLYTCNCTNCQTASGSAFALNMPVAHFYTRSAQPWVSPAADAVCHETQPSDVRSLAQAWRAQWP